MKCYIKAYVLRTNKFIYSRLLNLLKKRFNLTISISTLYYTIKKLDITRKIYRKKFIYTNRHKFKKNIKKFKSKIKNIQNNDIISIDETSIDTGTSSNYGWEMKGKRLYKKHFIKRRHRYTIILGISNSKVLHYKIINGSANAIDFKNFIIYMNNKYPINNKFLLMDNAIIHHSKIVKQLFNDNNFNLLYNVPYMPEYNPIEMAFSKIKLLLRRKNNNHDNRSLLKNIKNCIKQIKSSELYNYYKFSFNFK